jgi:hypothetical protein
LAHYLAILRSDTRRGPDEVPLTCHDAVKPGQRYDLAGRRLLADTSE